MVYGSLGLRPGLSDLLWAFRKANRLEEFPVYLDDHPFQIRERIRVEKEKGLRTADVVLMPHYMLLQMERDGLLARHQSEEAKAYSSKLRDTNLRWFAVAVTFMGMACQEKLLQERDSPRELTDLASPRWRGKLGTQSLTASKVGNLGAQYIAYLKRTAGPAWDEFINSLAGEGRPKAYDCIDHLLQGLVEGEHQVSLSVYSLAYHREKAAGTKLALLRMTDAPPMLTLTSAGILKGSEQNGAAAKFMEFLLSREAQRIMGRIQGLSPARRGIQAGYDFEVAYDEKSDFHPTPEDTVALPGILDKYRELGLP